MIAHAPVTPVVIPIFHTGMAQLIPLNPFTRKILHAVPRVGNTVTARAGSAIRCVLGVVYVGVFISVVVFGCAFVCTRGCTKYCS